MTDVGPHERAHGLLSIYLATPRNADRIGPQYGPYCNTTPFRTLCPSSYGPAVPDIDGGS